MGIATINPATGETLRTFEPHSAARVNDALDKGQAAFRRHRMTSFAERATHMRKAAEILKAECRELGRLMTVEMGKPIKAPEQEQLRQRISTISRLRWKAVRAGSLFSL